MSTTLATSDALAGLEVPKRFDVTKFPRDVEASVERTVNPFHRAILKNYFRHLLLEISGYWDQILVPELTIDEPVYRIGHLGRTIVLIGHDEVASFYRTTCETGKNVMGALPMYMCVDDFGVVTEARWPRFSPIFSPATSRASQKPTPTPITCSRTASSRFSAIHALQNSSVTRLRRPGRLPRRETRSRARRCSRRCQTRTGPIARSRHGHAQSRHLTRESDHRRLGLSHRERDMRDE